MKIETGYIERLTNRWRCNVCKAVLGVFYPDQNGIYFKSKDFYVGIDARRIEKGKISVTRVCQKCGAYLCAEISPEFPLKTLDKPQESNKI